MEELKKQIKTTTKPKFKHNANMTEHIRDKKSNVDEKIHQSIMRGELLRLANIIPSVRFNLKSLKEMNPKYLELAVNIIELYTQNIENIDIEIPLNIILSQLNNASYNNQESLDFTWNVIHQTDILTAKYYLATFASGAILDQKLKEQFNAAIPLIKYMLPTYQKNSPNLTKQKEFMQAVKIIINRNADPEKIKLIPKIKYIIDTMTRKQYNIDVYKILYSNVSAEQIINKLNTLKKEDLTENFDYTNYLIKNSL